MTFSLSLIALLISLGMERVSVFLQLEHTLRVELGWNCWDSWIVLCMGPFTFLGANPSFFCWGNDLCWQTLECELQLHFALCLLVFSNQWERGLQPQLSSKSSWRKSSWRVTCLAICSSGGKWLLWNKTACLDKSLGEDRNETICIYVGHLFHQRTTS